MFSASKNKNVMSTFTQGPRYSVATFERPGQRDPTGMRAEFLAAGKAAAARADPTGMRAEFKAAAATKKGGKRSRKLNTRRRKNRSSKRKN